MKTVKERQAAAKRKSLLVGGEGASAGCRRPRQALQTGEPADPPPKAADPPAVRTELVARIRAQIKAGTYETPQRMQAAIEKLLEDLG